MAKHVGFLLLIGIGLSAIAAASYGGSIGELEFADIEEHLESLTSASTSIGDIKDAVVPYLNNWRSKRSSSSSVENADTESSNASVEPTKKPSSSELPGIIREKRSIDKEEKRSGLDDYLKKLKEVLSVPKAAGELAKKVKIMVEKVNNISESLCKNCQDDDDEDDYYYDDDDDLYRFRRNVEDENPETTFEELVGLVQNINSRLVNRTKSLINAGLDAARKAVKVAFAMASEGLNPSETASEDTNFDNSSQTVQRIRRSTPGIPILEYLEEVKQLLVVFLMDTEFIVSDIFQSLSPQGKEAVQTILSALKKVLYIIRHIFNDPLGSVAQFKSSLDRTLIEVKRVILDVTEKVKGQVLKTLQEIPRLVQVYKYRLERGRRSSEGRETTEPKDVSNPVQHDPQPPSSNATTANPLVKGLNGLTNLTESVSEILDVVFDLTDIFSLRRKRDIDGEETEGKTSLNIFIEGMENGTLQVLANTKELIGRTIQELGQNVDLGLQRISSALSRQRRSAEDQFEVIKMFLRELLEAISIQLKKWFEEAILFKRQLLPYNGNGEEILRAIKLKIDLARKSIGDFLTVPDLSPPSLEEFEETDDSEVEIEGKKIVSRKRRFVLMDTLVGMLAAKATSTVAGWIYQTANHFTSDYLRNPQTEEQDLNTINRMKRESDNSLLTEIIRFPGRVLEGIIQRGKKRADAIRKVITGQETEDDSDAIYPGRR
ncbi:uncharacterized protein LOC109534211 isoform X1 [Dendroctonus ponderosae]|uniref:uncharacterized protein LOC109534211 isoform X1 n=1 Tax=Dendroctonus ponderosae TaxID=77166 RepID=UPI0020353DDC|nr:uncharacterized protein LOC109534211 isoform X1 [Dendroctonus ponderosae]